MTDAGRRKSPRGSHQPSPQASHETQVKRPGLVRLAWAVVVAAVIAVPLAVDPFANDSFRAPKMLLLRAIGLCLVALGVYWRASGGTITRESLRSPEFVVTAALLGWITLSTATSTNHHASVNALISVVCASTFFVAARLLGRDRSLSAVYALLVAPVVNTIMLLLQRTNVWNPFADIAREAGLSEETIDALSVSALVGNLNDVGASLVLGVIVAAAAAVTDRRRNWRIAAAITWLICVIGVITTANRGAILATLAGLLVMSVSLKPRQSIAILITVVLLAGVAARYYAPLELRVRVARADIKERRWNSLLSGRLVAFLAAVEMARDYPILGVGPSAFGSNYFDYKICAESRYSILRRDAEEERPPIFMEVHNDHLQVLAELGFPGYALMVTAFGLLAFSPRRKSARSENPRVRFVSIAALAGASALAVSALVQFPLQLAATAVGYLYFAGLCLAWRRDADA
jgi:O-antigen ligase